MNTNNRMLVNVTQANEEMRFAIIHKNYLENFYVERPGTQKKSNIYKGVITRVEPSLQAAFVDFGSNRHGFLPFKEISHSYYKKTDATNSSRPSISDVISEGQEVLIQVEKEERGNKGAALTTYITLAGSYLVLMPNNPRAGGISRRVEGEERDELRDILNGLTYSKDMGLIVRTAGVGKSLPELQWDLDVLLRLWDAIQVVYKEQSAPVLIHQESDIISKAIRDYLRKDTDEILIDDEEVFEKTKQTMAQIRPEFKDCVKLYTGSLPLFSRYEVEKQIETAHQREVTLPSGGSIVIEQTEAMVAVDVNSARDTKGGDIEQTAFNTNREAAQEVARQLRFRDLGGLIVVDFIDMLSVDNQREIVDAFYQETQSDRARVQFSRISRFGLLEVSRQRLRPSLSEENQSICRHCQGLGTVRTIESLSSEILRIVQEDAASKKYREINVQTPVSIAAYLMNEKRKELVAVENQSTAILRIIPNPHIDIPEYNIDRVYQDQRGASSSAKKSSYQMIDKPTPGIPHKNAQQPYQKEKPALKFNAPERPEDFDQEKSEGLLKRIWRNFTDSTESESSSEPQKPAYRPRQQQQRSRSGQQRQNSHQQRDRDPRKSQKRPSSYQSRNSQRSDDQPSNDRTHRSSSEQRGGSDQRGNSDQRGGNDQRSSGGQSRNKPQQQRSQSRYNKPKEQKPTVAKEDDTLYLNIPEPTTSSSATEQKKPVKQTYQTPSDLAKDLTISVQHDDDKPTTKSSSGSRKTESKEEELTLTLAPEVEKTGHEKASEQQVELEIETAYAELELSTEKTTETDETQTGEKTDDKSQKNHQRRHPHSRRYSRHGRRQQRPYSDDKQQDGKDSSSTQSSSSSDDNGSQS